VLEGGNCLSVWQSAINTLMPQRGADAIDSDAGCALRPRGANRSGRDGPNRAQRQAASSLMEPNKTWSPAESANRNQSHQPASIRYTEVLAGLILKIQAILSNTEARNPIATEAQP
jgi:hypothetical protein